MRKWNIVAAVVVCAAFAAGAPAQEPPAPVESDHLVIHRAQGVSDEAVEETKERGEAFYVQLVELLGHEPPAKINVILEGPAERPDGSWGYPRVDSFGRIHLFRYTPEVGSYFNSLAHEMVHVFRIMRPSKDWFFEEGFAEFVALRVDPSLDGFPWYGFPVDLVAGQWIARDKGIPLAEMRANHRALNLPCKAQTYALRSSFFDWLGDTFGDETVIDISARERAGELDHYESAFGATFEELTGRWRSELLNTYLSMEDADALTAEFLESPIQYMPVCDEGNQF